MKIQYEKTNKHMVKTDKNGRQFLSGCIWSFQMKVDGKVDNGEACHNYFLEVMNSVATTTNMKDVRLIFIIKVGEQYDFFLDCKDFPGKRLEEYIELVEYLVKKVKFPSF